MPAINVAPYESSGAAAWDDLVSRAAMGTLLHTRRFLGYHGDRFRDASVVLDDGDRLVGVMPAAVVPADPDTVASHPGATFGGIVHAGSLTGSAMVVALERVADHFRKLGFRRLGYAPVPLIYHRQPSADDLYALFRLDAHRTRCDLSCVVDLDDGAKPSSRRRRGLRRAERADIQVAEGPALVEELWPVVEANLAARHGARPVHSSAEMRLLVDLFPSQIAVVLARYRGQAVAGVILFENGRVSHAQYIASNADGNNMGALDAVFAHCLSRAVQRGARFFDFGTSNRDAGQILNEGLYGFKAQFGGAGVTYEYYELRLDAE